MQILPAFRGALVCFWLSLLFSASFCHGDDNTVEVVGMGECADCAQSKIKTSQAFSALRVTIDCKTENGEFKTRGVGKFDEEGKFKVSLPHDIINDGKIKEECYAQLHSASATPCPTQNGLEASKIVFKSKTNGIHTFGLAGKLKFSPVTCTSALLWPPFKYPIPSKFPPLPKYKSHPPLSFPPLPPKVFPPIYKKPLPPPFPPLIPKFKKPLPPPIAFFKKPFLKKPLPPLVPIYKKPLPPLVPIFKKPLPPTFPKYKKPLPPIPKIPPKYFHHPKFGKFPPPSFPQT